MTNSELNNFVVITETQKRIKAQYEENQVVLVSLRQNARKFLRESARADKAIFELDGNYYYLFIDPDDDIQVEPIQKIC